MSEMLGRHTTPLVGRGRHGIYLMASAEATQLISPIAGLLVGFTRTLSLGSVAATVLITLRWRQVSLQRQERVGSASVTTGRQSVAAIHLLRRCICGQRSQMRLNVLQLGLQNSVLYLDSLHFLAGLIVELSFALGLRVLLRVNFVAAFF